MDTGLRTGCEERAWQRSLAAEVGVTSLLSRPRVHH
jgi:hypothetical protein